MMKNKSTLAKLLAEEDIFVVHKQMETAYFNSKSRELGLPIWKDEEMTKDIYDLMVGHEIGHALWTPLDMLENAQIRKIDHGFVNILEDVRIDKKVKNKYPGLIGIYNRGYVDLAKKNFFGTDGKDISKMGLIDRINLFFKGNGNIEFSNEEKVWVDRAAKTVTPDDVLDLAEELYAWLAENAPEESDDEKTMSDPNGESGEGEEGETGEGNAPAGDDGEEKTGEGNPSAGEDKGEEDGNDAPVAGAGDDGNDDADGNAKTEEGESSEVGGVNSTGTGSVPKATTDAASKDVMDALRDKDAADRTYANIPKVNLDEIIVKNKTLLDEFKSAFLAEKNVHGSVYWDRTLAELETLKSESKATVSYMVKEFEMKKAADQYARAATSKTGSLDMSKLHTYKYNEDLFKKVTTLPGATNHGMVMVLDWSGSMAENLKGTLAQMFNLIWFCRRIKIPFEVFAFSDAYDRNVDYHRRFEIRNTNFKAGDIVLNNFKLLNFFSSNLAVSDEMEMMHILWMYASRWGGYRDWSADGYPYSPAANLNLGGTPLNDAIVAMMDLLPKFKADTGVQKVNTIFLTDGASNGMDRTYDYRLDTETGEHEEIIKSWKTYYSSRSPDLTDNLIITDPVMNKKYTTSTAGGNITNELLVILKNRVAGMNVVGFFIAGSGKSGRVDKRTLAYLLNEYDSFKIMEKVKFLNKNKYLAITQLGYDEYYVLPGGGSLSVENETLSDDLIGAKKGKLKSAFGKIAKGKIASRPLLNKFVKMVA